jgi:hypothetical protein
MGIDRQRASGDAWPMSVICAVRDRRAMYGGGRSRRAFRVPGVGKDELVEQFLGYLVSAASG